ncbi:MAG TPA: shikimate kinase [Tepidisphaeraceae bacterium]|nr:shikimate kinase [Tepidisphaeraceae bacterium]
MGVVLLGLRGSGKTTLGRLLADRLWGKCVDTDELITRAAGKSIAEIFATVGESGFRDLEEIALREALAGKPEVISAGGGIVLREANRTALKSSNYKRIYLRCEPSELHRRVIADPSTVAARPQLTSVGGLAEIEQLMRDREPLYREVITGELDVTNLSPEEAVTWLGKMA